MLWIKFLGIMVLVYDNSVVLLHHAYMVDVLQPNYTVSQKNA